MNQNLSQQIAKHFRDVYFGGNWTSVNLKDTLSEISWQQATRKVQSFNTIAVLLNHLNYYIGVVTKVLEGGPLEGNDKLSFDEPAIESQREWQYMLDKTWSGAENFAGLVEQLPESKLWEDFSGQKYGNYYRNLHGIIEHCHYHLGQMVLIKKML